MANKKFPSECNPRGVVKPLDKVLIYNSDTGASDEFSTVGQLTKIQDDAINALNDTKVDNATLESTKDAWAFIFNNQNIKIENLEDEMPLKVDRADIVDNLTTNDGTKPLSAKQGKILQDEMPLKEVISNKVNTLKNIPTVEQYPTAKITADTFVNNEEALANVLNTMRGEINALKQVIAQGILTKVKIGEADIQKLKYQGSEMTLSGVGVPSVIPDFLGQRYVQVGVKVWESVGISSVADWK